MGFTRITEEDIKNKGVSGLPDTPNLPVADMQAKFDELAKDVIVPKVNALVDELESENASEHIGIIPPEGFTGVSVQALCDEFASVFGANESSHVHTNMPVLDGFEDADHLKHNGTNVMLESDMSDYVTSEELSTEQMNQYRNIMGQVSELYNNVNDRIDETNITIVDNLTETVKGKALDATQGAILDGKITATNAKATESYDMAGRALNGISYIQSTYAKKTELPEIATTGKVGTVKPDGSTITVDSDGTIHAVGGSGGGGTGGTSNYNDLSNKPSINGVTLSGNKTLDDIGVGALAEEKVSGLHEDTLGGFTPVIEPSTGKIIGYTTKIGGADTVFPFSKSNKFVNLNVIMSTNGSAARPVSYATRNDAEAEYFGDFVTGSDKNTATMTIKKSGTYKILFRTAYRVTQSNCSLKHNDTYIAQNVSGNSEVAEYEINANAGDTIILGITNKTSGYGFQCADVIVYVA